MAYFSNFDPVGLKSGLANWASSWLVCEGHTLATFAIMWQDLAAAPVGLLGLEGNAHPQVLDDNALDVQYGEYAPDPQWTVPIPVATGFFGAWPNVGGAGGNIAIVVIKNPLRLHRVTFTYDSGGAAAQFKIARSLTK